MIFIDYGGNGPNASVYERDRSKHWIKDVTPKTCKEATRVLKATSAPSQISLEAKLLDELERDEHGAAANEILNAMQAFRNELCPNIEPGHDPAAAEEGATATATRGYDVAVKRIPVYMAQTGPLRSKFFESKRLH